MGILLVVPAERGQDSAFTDPPIGTVSCQLPTVLRATEAGAPIPLSDLNRLGLGREFGHHDDRQVILGSQLQLGVSLAKT